MQLTEAVPKPTFANHETFHLRYSWLKKAYDQIKDDSKIFNREDAPVKLGVGKNMVRSMRFWALANKIVEQAGSVKNSNLTPTDIGDAIFHSTRGIDPYLERPETIWLLHWLLFAPPCRIPVWWMIMNDFPATNVKIENITEAITSRVTNMAEWQSPSPKSIKKDVGVFIHTYTTNQGKSTVEDYLDCPFRQMRMVKQGSGDTMRFVFGKKYGLSPLIAAFACLDWISRSNITAKNVSISRLATEAGSVGNIFKISENDLFDLIEQACKVSDLIKIQNINGAPHLTFDSAKETSVELLSLEYKKKIKSAPVIQGKLR